MCNKFPFIYNTTTSKIKCTGNSTIKVLFVVPKSAEKVYTYLHTYQSNILNYKKAVTYINTYVCIYVRNVLTSIASHSENSTAIM